MPKYAVATVIEIFIFLDSTIIYNINDININDQNLYDVIIHRISVPLLNYPILDYAKFDYTKFICENIEEYCSKLTYLKFDTEYNKKSEEIINNKIMQLNLQSQNEQACPDIIFYSNVLFDMFQSKIPYIAIDNKLTRIDTLFFLQKLAELSENDLNSVSYDLMKKIKLNFGKYSENIIKKIMTTILKILILNKMLCYDFKLTDSQIWGIDDKITFSHKINLIIDESLTTGISNTMIMNKVSRYISDTLMNHNKIQNTNSIIIPNIIKDNIEKCISANDIFTKHFDLFNKIFSKFKITETNIDANLITNDITNVQENLHRIIFFTQWDVKMRGHNINNFMAENAMLDGIISNINNNYQDVIYQTIKKLQHK